MHVLLAQRLILALHLLRPDLHRYVCLRRRPTRSACGGRRSVLALALFKVRGSWADSAREPGGCGKGSALPDVFAVHVPHPPCGGATGTEPTCLEPELLRSLSVSYLQKASLLFRACGASQRHEHILEVRIRHLLTYEVALYQLPQVPCTNSLQQRPRPMRVVRQTKTPNPRRDVMKIHTYTGSLRSCRRLRFVGDLHKATILWMHQCQPCTTRAELRFAQGP